MKAILIIAMILAFGHLRHVNGTFFTTVLNSHTIPSFSNNSSYNHYTNTVGLASAVFIYDLIACIHFSNYSEYNLQKRHFKCKLLLKIVTCLSNRCQWASSYVQQKVRATFNEKQINDHFAIQRTLYMISVHSQLGVYV